VHGSYTFHILIINHTTPKAAKLYDETLRKKIAKHEVQIYILDGLSKDED